MDTFYRDVERNALLDELKQCLMNDSKEYFNKIKPKIVEVIVFLLHLNNNCFLLFSELPTRTQNNC